MVAGPPYLPNGKQALVAWIKTIPGIDASKVATTLPADPRAWAVTGFVTVGTAGGSPTVGMALRRPVLSVSAWRVNLNSEKTPWGETHALAEQVFNAFYDSSLFPARVAPPSYRPISIRTGWPIGEPRDIPGSLSGYAQVQFDAQLIWSVTS